MLFSFVFQDPMTALNPTIPIGKQIAEAILVHEPKLPKEEVYNRVSPDGSFACRRE